MPIPTDTYWNIKRLNVVFAASGVLFFLTMVWATLQDFHQGWRQPQRDGRVWEAALVSEKIERESTPEKEARLKELQDQIKVKQKEVDAQKDQRDKLQAQIQKAESDQTDMEFRLNTLKANVAVDESQLQDALAAKDTNTIKRLQAKLAEPRKKLGADNEAMWNKKEDIRKLKEDLARMDADLTDLQKQKTKMTAEEDGLKKKLASLQPQGVLAHLSNQMRETPLMQFINPATKVQQVVLPDVLTSLGGVKNVETMDRCMTCHVNINKKEFTEPNILAFLEEQVAASRKLKLAETYSGKSADALATRDKPGAVAMPEFWHLWAVRIAPEQVRKAGSLGRISTLAKSVGPGKVQLKVGGQTIESFNYVPDPAKKDDAASSAMNQATRDQVVALLIKAWIGYDVGKANITSAGPISVKIPESTDEKTAAIPRTAAMKYVEDVRASMGTTLPGDTLKLLNDRYRRGLIAEANVARKKQGLKALDPSPALLAHPRLDLYVDVDSKHSFEAVGCTSCHDGSGQETHFVLTAHMARPIWVDQKTGASVLPAQLDPTQLPAEHHGEDLSSMLTAVYSHDEVVPEKASDIHLVLGAHGEKHAEKHDDEHATTKPATTQAAKPQAAVHVPNEPPADTIPVPYFDPVTGATGRAVSQMQYWQRTYEPSAPRSFALVYHEWDWPMRPPKYLQANCVRCHNDVNSIKDYAPKVFEGRSLFINMGCVNCHQMDAITPDFAPQKPSDIRLILANGQRKVGTDLRNITAKLSPAYLNTWIWAPKAFRPSTKMPHFFMLENNSSDEELRRTRQEARAITEYIVRTANVEQQRDATGKPVVDQNGAPLLGPQSAKHFIAAGAKGSPEAGKAIFSSIGCQGCHTNLNDDAGEKRNNKLVTVGEKWIVTDLVKSGELAKKMEAELGKAPDAKAVTTRAQELYDHMTYNERQLYITEHLAPDYSGAAAKYPDNTPKPIFQHHGPELSGVGTKLLADRTPEQARLWLYNWVKDPRHYSEYTVMPQLRLTDQQALDLTEYLLAQKRTNDKPDDGWKAELTPADTPKLIELTAQFLRSRFSANIATQRADNDDELLALATDALTTAKVTADIAKEQAAKLSKDEKRLVFLGKKLVAHYGCMNCHGINGTETMSSPCANLSDWGQKGLDKLDFGYLDHHKLSSLPPTSKIPMVNGVSEKATELVGAEWKAHFGEGGVAQPVEVAWPHVGHSRTDWLSQKLKNTRAYDRGKSLLEPDPKANDERKSGKPYDKLKMPTFYLNDKEVDAIVTWVISNRDRLISHKLANATMTDQSKLIARGRHVLQKYNCVACHVVETNAPSVHQFYKADEITTRAPPSLRGEGNKIQHDWLFNFLKNVEPLRPLLNPPADKKPEIRMPSFPITDEESTAVAAYFASLSTKEAKTLDKTLSIVLKYLETQQEAAIKPVRGAATNPTTLRATAGKKLVDDLIAHAGAQIKAKNYEAAKATLADAQKAADALKLSEQSGATTKPVSTRLKDAIGNLNSNQVPLMIPWPGDDWFTRPEFTTAAASLKDWALLNKQISELQLDPTKNKPEEIARNYRTILFKARFVEELYDAPYPFVDTPRPDVSDADFKKGEALFYEMQCLKCHVLGDPNVPGAQKAPTAPNLSLTQRRLQRRWVRDWVQEPAIIQVGTAMPPFFTGLAIFDVHGMPWPRSQGVAEAEAKRIESVYGADVEEQANLVLDFLYAAGVKGYTGIQPATTATPPTPVVNERDPAAGVKPTEPPTATQPLVPGDASKNTAAEKPGAPSPKATDTPAPKPEPKKEEPKPAPAKPQAASGAASVKGVVMLDGKAPEVKDIDMSGVKECAAQHGDPVPEETMVVSDKGQLKNVVIYVSGGLSQTSFDPPAEPAVLDQQGCMYTPHVLPVMVGQQIRIKNSDPFLHNVHSLSNDNPPFNFGQPTKDPGKEVEPLKAAETFRVKCDVHPWMSAYVVAMESPYFAVSGDDGSFAINGLPPGEYTLTAWHEQLGTKEIPVKIEPDKPADVKVSFPAP